MRYLTLTLLLFLLNCCTHHREDPAVAQIKIRTMQTHTFVGVDAKTVAKEMIAVLQDEGFMIKNISHDIGLITAERDTNIEKFSSKFWAYIFSGKRARWRKHSMFELSSNISEELEKTKIRINLLVRVFDNLGHVVDVHQVLDEQVYVDFFNKIQKGLFAKQMQ